ncbi:MAG: four helix bundle protein [Candidatus Paceibacterota bacterium]
MDTNNQPSKYSIAPPPREAPRALLKMKELYCFWLKIYRNFPKVERFGIGQKIDGLFLEALELIFSSVYLPPEHKIILLAKAISKIDSIKFFIQLAWEDNLITTEKYSQFLSGLEEIGKMLWGWKSGLQNKTSAK